MVYIKAMNLRSSIKFMTEKFGEDKLQAAVDTLSDEDKAIINDRNLLANQWITLDLWVRFHEAAVRELNNNDDSIMFEAGVHNATKDLNTVYKALLRMASPEFVVKRIGIVPKTYLKSDRRKVEVKVTQLDRNKFTIKVYGLKPHHRIFELGVLGWLKGALELSGAKNITVDHMKSFSKDEGCFETLLAWE